MDSIQVEMFSVHTLGGEPMEKFLSSKPVHFQRKQGSQKYFCISLKVPSKENILTSKKIWFCPSGQAFQMTPTVIRLKTALETQKNYQSLTEDGTAILSKMLLIQFTSHQVLFVSPKLSYKNSQVADLICFI